MMKEALAAHIHEMWSGWMKYLFSFGTINPDGSFTIQADKVARWKRQVSTPYHKLSKEEKESDRREADRLFDVVATYIKENIFWI